MNLILKRKINEEEEKVWKILSSEITAALLIAGICVLAYLISHLLRPEYPGEFTNN